MTTLFMWLSGRRAVRPDRDYYRNVRRARIRTGMRSRGGEIGALAIVATVAGMILIVWVIVRAFN